MAPHSGEVSGRVIGLPLLAPCVGGASELPDILRLRLDLRPSVSSKAYSTSSLTSKPDGLVGVDTSAGVG